MRVLQGSLNVRRWDGGARKETHAYVFVFRAQGRNEVERILTHFSRGRVEHAELSLSMHCMLRLTTMMNHEYYFVLAADVAQSATCERAKCGSVIVSEDGETIGEGYNAPPLEDETRRTCGAEWDTDSKPKYDKTCCVHAEWNAILNACKNALEKISKSTLYFMRVDENSEYTDAGEPYCTVCSRLALQSGIAFFCIVEWWARRSISRRV